MADADLASFSHTHLVGDSTALLSAESRHTPLRVLATLQLMIHSKRKPAASTAGLLLGRRRRSRRRDYRSGPPPSRRSSETGRSRRPAECRACVGSGTALAGVSLPRVAHSGSVGGGTAEAPRGASARCLH